MEFRIKKARERMGLSQRDLAKVLNIKPTTFNGYETGAHDPKSDVLAEIARACDTTVDFLLGLSDEPQRIKNTPAPAEPETGGKLQEIAGIFEQITEEGQEDIVKYSRYVATKLEYKKYTEAKNAKEA